MNRPEQSSPTSWNTHLYQQRHSFVWKYGESLVECLQAQPHETIVDLGCGTGQLTRAIANRGASVIGIDADAAMVSQARHHNPDLPFLQADARYIQINSAQLQLGDRYKPEGEIDAIFSNAVLHWIPETDAVISSMYRLLRPGGRLVAELGGRGNVQTILNALYASIEEQLAVSKDSEISEDRPLRSYSEQKASMEFIKALNPWYFPSLGEYTSLLDAYGFETKSALLFDRPTPLDGENGMAHWLTQFAAVFLEPLSPPTQLRVIRSTIERLKPHLYQNEMWIADYRRLRVVAVKLR